MLPKLAIAKEISHLGVSMLIVSLGASLLSIYVNRYLNAHGGATYIALSYIISRLTQLAIIPNSAISLGISPILGFNYGANQYARVLSALKKAHHMLLAFAFIIFLFLMIVPQWALKIFTNDPWLLQEGPWFIRLCFITWLMVPISNIGMIALASMGKAKINLRLSIFNEIILAGALLFILSYFFGLKGIYYKIPAVDILRGALVAIFLWKEIKVLKQDLSIKSNNMVPVTT